MVQVREVGADRPDHPSARQSGVRPDSAWPLPAAGPRPAIATPPVSSAPAIIRFRVRLVCMVRCPFVRRSPAGRPLANCSPREGQTHGAVDLFGASDAEPCRKLWIASSLLGCFVSTTEGRNHEGRGLRRFRVYRVSPRRRRGSSLSSATAVRCSGDRLQLPSATTLLAQPHEPRGPPVRTHCHRPAP